MRNTITEVQVELVEELKALGINTSISTDAYKEILIDGKPLYITHADNAKRNEYSRVLDSSISNHIDGLPRWVSFVKPYPAPRSTRATICVERGSKIFAGCTDRAMVAEAAAYIKSQL